MTSATDDSSATVHIASDSGGPIGRWLGRAKVLLGLGLAGSAGMWGGRAWSEDNSLLYLPGLVSLVCGAILAVSGVQGSIPHRQHRAHRRGQPWPLSPTGTERAIPLLGELLIHKYHLITESDLTVALEEQRKRGGRLGQILIALGMLDQSQLTKALEDQLAYGDPWREMGGAARWEKGAAALEVISSMAAKAAGEQAEDRSD